MKAACDVGKKEGAPVIATQEVVVGVVMIFTGGPGGAAAGTYFVVDGASQLAGLIGGREYDVVGTGFEFYYGDQAEEARFLMGLLVGAAGARYSTAAAEPEPRVLLDGKSVTIQEYQYEWSKMASVERAKVLQSKLGKKGNFVTIGAAPFQTASGKWRVMLSSSMAGDELPAAAARFKFPWEPVAPGLGDAEVKLMRVTGTTWVAAGRPICLGCQEAMGAFEVYALTARKLDLRGVRSAAPAAPPGTLPFPLPEAK